MPKNSISEWSTTAGDNTDVGGISILGSANVSNFDGALREIMAQVATFSDLAPAGYLNGLTLSNNSTDATNDIDVAAGSAASDGATPVLMTLASAMTKRLDEAWAVGTNAGGLDTGSVANGTYHLWLIQRSDTGVVDVIFSTNAATPTMPANYDRKRRIGSIIRESAAILGFKQFKRQVLLNSPRLQDSTTTTFSSTLISIGAPAGIQTRPILISQILTGNDANIAYSVGSAANSSAVYDVQSLLSNGSTNAGDRTVIDFVVTNTSSQIYHALAVAAGSITQRRLELVGWYDDAL